MPKVSVLMPVYNTKGEYLKESIESILNQTYKDFEFLILDDGSTNSDTLNTLSYYANKDFRIKILNGHHKGIGFALNSLMDSAKGEFMARMDSDDISLPQRLEKQVKFLEENKDVSILGSWLEMFPGNEVVKYPAKPKILDFLSYCCFAHATAMIRKADFDKYSLRYKEDFSVSEDYELWSRAVRFLNFFSLQESLYKYRILENSNSRNNMEKVLKVDNTIRKNILDFLTSDSYLQSLIKGTIGLADDVCDLSFIEKLFSTKRVCVNGKHKKIIRFFGVKVTTSCKTKYKPKKENVVLR